MLTMLLSALFSTASASEVPTAQAPAVESLDVADDSDPTCRLVRRTNGFALAGVGVGLAAASTFGAYTAYQYVEHGELPGEGSSEETAMLLLTFGAGTYTAVNGARTFKRRGCASPARKAAAWGGIIGGSGLALVTVSFLPGYILYGAVDIPPALPLTVMGTAAVLTGGIMMAVSHGKMGRELPRVAVLPVVGSTTGLQLAGRF